MNMISKDFKDVEKTEAWKFLQDHDPVLELDLLQFLNEAESVWNESNLNKSNSSFTFRGAGRVEITDIIFQAVRSHLLLGIILL